MSLPRSDPFCIFLHFAEKFFGSVLFKGVGDPQDDDRHGHKWYRWKDLDEIFHIRPLLDQSGHGFKSSGHFCKMQKNFSVFSAFYP